MWINQNFYLDITIYNDDGQVFNDNCYSSLTCFIVQHMVHTRLDAERMCVCVRVGWNGGLMCVCVLSLIHI